MRLLLRAVLAGLALTFLVLTCAPGANAAARAGQTASADAEADSDDTVELTLFWGDGCPHCADEKEWLASIRDDYPDLTVTMYEVWYDQANQQLLAERAEELGFEPTGVPVTIVGDQVWTGWSDAVQEQVEYAIKFKMTSATGPSADGEASTVDVPLIGEVKVSADSLVFSTLVIGFVDGVNPCSLWVISVLLAIVVRTGSRRRVFAVGLTFLVVTAAMYALYMAGIYSALNVISHLGQVQLLVAVVAGVFGVVSIKDYFAYKQGVSFTIPDSAKPGLYRRMRNVAGEEALLPALAATVALAVGVSLLETPCTAGFPVLWAGLLEAQAVTTAQAVGLFALYMLPFLLDELIIFGIAVFTLRATKLQERHGRLLKLFAGIMMLALAATVLLNPAAMSNPIRALTVFAAAFALALVVHLITRAVSDRADPTPG